MLFFGIFLQNKIFQAEISNFSRKMGTMGEAIFPLTTHEVKSTFGVVVSLVAY